MKKIIFLFFIIFSSHGLAQTQNDPLNVLFVGNSLTYFNDLPLTFKTIAEEQGYYINLDQHTPGGNGFANHIDNVTLLDKFDNTVWDYVILQPSSAESYGVSQPILNTIDNAEILRDKVYENSPCASIYLYEISYGIVEGSSISLQQYLNRQAIIKSNLIQMSNATNIPLVPVGEAFQTSIQQSPAHFLWVAYNDVHPNANGSFLAACAFYNALFQKPILNLIFNGELLQEDADYFRETAEDITLNNFSDWNIDTLVAHADFTSSSTDLTTVTFNNTSTNYDSVSWDFGDGSSSTLLSPNHLFDFSLQNNYDVYLTALKGCKEHHYLQKISQASLSTESFNIENVFNVFPNPVESELTISSTSNSLYDYSLYDMLGKQIKIEINVLNSIKIDASNLESGFYLLVIETEGETKQVKILKK